MLKNSTPSSPPPPPAREHRAEQRRRAPVGWVGGNVTRKRKEDETGRAGPRAGVGDRRGAAAAVTGTGGEMRGKSEQQRRLKVKWDTLIIPRVDEPPQPPPARFSTLSPAGPAL